MITIRVRLTTEDVANGAAAEPVSCPVARALNRCGTSALGGYWEVTPEFLLWHTPTGSRWSWITPVAVARWVKAFDKHGGVDDRRGWRRIVFGAQFSKSLSFDLEVPEPQAYANFKVIPGRSGEVQIALQRRQALRPVEATR